jgi:hypothetical protein
MSSRPPTPDEAMLPQIGDDAEREASLHRFVPGRGMETVSYDDLKTVGAPPPARKRRAVDVILALAAAASVFGAITYVRGSGEAPRSREKETAPVASSPPPAETAALPAASAAAPIASATPADPPPPAPVRAIRRSAPPRRPPATTATRSATEDPWGWKR